MAPRNCRSCGKKTMRLRCATCERNFQRWLDGGPHYRPEWDGVVGAPADSDEPRSIMDRALAQKRDE